MLKFFFRKGCLIIIICLFFATVCFGVTLIMMRQSLCDICSAPPANSAIIIISDDELDRLERKCVLLEKAFKDAKSEGFRFSELELNYLLTKHRWPKEFLTTPKLTISNDEFSLIKLSIDLGAIPTMNKKCFTGDFKFKISIQDGLPIFKLINITKDDKEIPNFISEVIKKINFASCLCDDPELIDIIKHIQTAKTSKKHLVLTTKTDNP